MTPRRMEMFSRAAASPHGTPRGYTPAPLVKARFLSTLSLYSCTVSTLSPTRISIPPSSFRGDVERGGDTYFERVFGILGGIFI